MPVQKAALTAARIWICVQPNFERPAVSQRKHPIRQWSVRILCAVALLLVGFAHRPPVLGNQAEDYAAYRLPDGSLPSLCITATDEDGKDTTHHKWLGQGCEACRIGASVLLPHPNDLTGVHLTYQRAVPPPHRPETFRRQLYPPNTGPRAPPSAPIMT
jgi:hypothetical protein